MNKKERRIIKAALFAVYMHEQDKFLIDGHFIKKNDVINELYKILNNDIRKKKKYMKKIDIPVGKLNEEQLCALKAAYYLKKMETNTFIINGQLASKQLFIDALIDTIIEEEMEKGELNVE